VITDNKMQEYIFFVRIIRTIAVSYIFLTVQSSTNSYIIYTDWCKLYCLLQSTLQKYANE